MMVNFEEIQDGPKNSTTKLSINQINSY